MKQVGVRDAVVSHGGLQNGFRSFMPDDIFEHARLLRFFPTPDVS